MFVNSVPTEPRKVVLEAINSTAIRILWRPPPEFEINGVIRGYRVFYVAANDTAVEPSTAASTVLDLSDPTAMEVVVSGLQAYTFYQVQVVAYGRKGVGEMTKPKRVRTKGSGELDATVSRHCVDFPSI